MALTYTGLTRHLDVRGTIYKSDGTSINLDASQINNYKISESCASNGIPLGTTQSSTFVLAIKNVDHTLTAESLDGAVVAMEIAIETVDGYVWSNLGVWRVEDVSLPEQSNVATLYGADGLSGAEFAKVFEDDGTYPQTLADLLRRVCAAAEVALYSDELPNADAQISQKPDWPEGITLRGVIGYVAACMGGFARINRSGQLQIVPFGRTRTHALDHAIYKEFSPQNGEEFVFNCIQYTDGETTTRYAIDASKEDTALNTIIVSGNPIMTPAMLQAIVTSMTGLHAIGAKLEWGGDPAVQCGDKIAVTDKSESTQVMLINSQELTVSGGFSASTVCNLPSVTKNEAESYKTRVSLLDVNGYINPKRIKDLSATISNNRVVKEALQKIEQAEKDLATMDGTVTELSTTVDEVAGELSSKVDQKTYNSLAGTVSSHTTQIQQNAQAISSKAEASVVNTLSGTVSSHTTAIQQNAQAISSKAEASVVNTLSGTVQTLQSDVQQTPEKISAAVKAISIGGTNLIRLENPNNGYVYAEKRVDQALIGKTFYKSGTTLVLRRPAAGSAIVNFSDVPLMGTPDKPGQYVLSFYAWSVGESDLTFYTDLFEYWEGDHYYYITDHTVGAEVTKFELPITYTAGQRVANLRFHTNHVWGNPDAYICITDVKLEEGTKATTWSASEEEFRAGSSVAITRDEVRFDTPLFSVHTGDAGDMAIDKDGMSIGNIAATRSLTAPNIAYSKAAASYEVGAGRAYTTLDQVFAELNHRVLTGDVFIRIYSQIYGHPVLKGTGGTGSIHIYGQNQTLVGSLTVQDCKNDIDLTDLTVQTDNGSTPVYVWNCSLFRATGCTFDASYLAQISINVRASKAYLFNIGLYRCLEWYLRIDLMSHVVCNGLSGGSSDHWWCYATESVLTFYGTIPQGPSNLVGCLYTPADYYNLPVNPGTNPTPQPSATTVTLSPTDYRTNYNTSSWQSKQSQLYQGMYGADKYRAVYWFSNSGLSGKTVKSATLTLTRVSGPGSGAATSVHLWGTPLASASGNPTTNRVDYGEIGNLTYGETKEFSIPLTAAQAFASGSIKGFIIDPNDSAVGSRGYSANYGKLESASTLKITY